MIYCRTVTIRNGFCRERTDCMSAYQVLYNPLVGNGQGEERSRKLTQILSGDTLVYRDITTIDDYGAYFAALPKGTGVIIAGGDGTLNRFINDTAALTLDFPVSYYATGSGNDFLRDVNTSGVDSPVPVDEYLHNLPRVTVNGKTYRFLNGVGFGIDGYCCEVGDRMRAEAAKDSAHAKPINYTAIAIKGLLGGFHPVNATVTVDGHTEHFRKVWLAPTMNGRYYGGGMMAAPEQKRLGDTHTVSTMLIYGAGKLRTLIVFPGIFKGEHVKHTNMVKVLSGKDIIVTFDRPTALQIDGETISGVTEYRVEVGAPVMATV